MPIDKRCSWRRRTASYNRAIGTLGFVLKAFIPTMGIILLYLHMWIKIKTASQVTQAHGAAARKKITRTHSQPPPLVVPRKSPANIAYHKEPAVQPLARWSECGAGPEAVKRHLRLRNCLAPFLLASSSQPFPRRSFSHIILVS